MTNNKKEFKYKGKDTPSNTLEYSRFLHSYDLGHLVENQESCFESAGTDSTSDINLNLLLGNKNGQNKES